MRFNPQSVKFRATPCCNLGPCSRLLEEANMVQTLRDAEAMVFMERNFPQV